MEFKCKYALIFLLFCFICYICCIFRFSIYLMQNFLMNYFVWIDKMGTKGNLANEEENSMRTHDNMYHVCVPTVS